LTDEEKISKYRINSNEILMKKDISCESCEKNYQVCQ